MDDLISRAAAIAEAYDVVIDGSVFKVVQVETLYGLPTIDAVDQSDLLEALAAAEQRGYNKGLADGLKDAAAIIAKREWRGAKND